MNGASFRLFLVTSATIASIGLGSSCARETPRERFERSVLPLLERRCGSSTCHGVEEGAEARGEVVDFHHFHFRVSKSGVASDPGGAYANVKARIDTGPHPELSTLLRKPLAAQSGGLSHAGGVSFLDRADPAYAEIRAWIASEEGGGESGKLEDLPANVQRFAREVLPLIASKQCMNAGCHATPAPFTAFEPPMELDGERVYSIASIEKNYGAARIHLALGGDLMASRLIRKTIPLDRGGIVHRGGNDVFFDARTAKDVRDEPAVKAILGWAAAEQTVVPKVNGFVYVRGPVVAESPFVHDAFVAGTDLWVLEGGARRNLTASLHGAPADVRDPTVRHDGARVAFAMRRSLDEAHQIWEIGVDGSGARQLTHDDAMLPGGGRVANVQPTYGPDGRIYFVSTRAGHLAEGLDALDTEIWAVDPESRALERITHGPSPEVTPSFIPTGKSYGTLAFTELRRLGGRYSGVVLRMPLDHDRGHHGDAELHIHHGGTLPADVLYAMRTTPDGRFVATLQSKKNVWRGGGLAIFDRQLGPRIVGSDPASLPAHRDALAMREKGFDRHPVPLPDGRIVVSHAEIDPDDAAAKPKLVLQTLSLAEGPTRVTARETLLEDDESVYDAEPIVARPLEDAKHPLGWDPKSTTGVLAYRHVEVLEALFTRLSPTGVRTLRDDLAFARILEAVPLTPKDLEGGPISIGSHGRYRILGEVPLAGGSLQVQVPAHRAIRVQTLDASRMSAGTQHARWVDVFPGETFPGGVSPTLYPVLCAGCHGALSGRPGEVGGPVPDAITGASITLATHQNLDPRRPLPPTTLGAPIEIDFRRDVAPLFARSCARCHGSAGGLDLSSEKTAHFDTLYETLLASGDGSRGGRKYVDEAGSSAYGSFLVERILGRELGAPRVVNGRCAGEPALTQEEILTIIRWIELGAVYRGGSP